jgi:alkylation response protein AidB-like acyl-CoA dehydrogenase
MYRIEKATSDMENELQTAERTDASARRVLSNPEVTGLEVRQEVRRWIDANRALIDEVYVVPTTSSVVESLASEVPWLETLWGHGWTRWGWPSEVDGFGGGPRLRAMVFDAFRSYGYHLPERINMLETLGQTLIEFIPRFASKDIGMFLRGEQMWAQSFSEPDAGSDMASMRTTARRDGDEFVVNGQKIWNSYGHVGDRGILLARTGTQESAHRGLSMFWIDMDTPGITARGIKQASGRDEFAEVFFDDVRIPADRLMGELNQGWGVAMYLMQYERGTFAWWRQTIMSDRLEDIAKALRSRGSFDEEAARSLSRTYRVLSVLRSRTATTVARLQAGETLGPDSSIDKVLLSRAERSLADLEHLVFYPAMEFGVDDHATHLREDWFHSRAVSIYGGATEIQYDIIADRILGMPREPRNGR